MKRLSTIMTCLLAMMAASMSAKAQEVTITLMPGWTWISIPSTETMDFATALGSFTPAVGDRIKSQWGIATYRGNGEWRGQLSEFYPGYGYMYYSARLVPVSVTFNAQQPTQQVVVTTDTPQFITGNSAMGGGNVASNDGTYILVKGICWATHENPTTNDDFYQEAESGVGTFSVSMTGLNIATTYYVRAFAVTPNGTVYGDQKSFTTRDGIPTVTTDTITSITGVTANCGGSVTDNGGLNVTARGVCWSTSQNPTVSDSHTTNGSGLGDFTSSITGLSLSTTYYVRAYATTSQGTAYGEEVSFTTRDGIPIVTTAEVTDIQGETATCGGNVTDNCGLTVIARGVCWSTSQNPTLDDSHTTNGSGMGSFSSSITGLSISTTYYVRAYATTSAGTGYGEQVSFTTRNGIPTVTTVEVSQIQGLAATSGGNITDDGGLAVTARGVCWSTSPSPTLANSHTTNGSGAGSFSSTMIGLTMSTTYYVRAYATNSFVTVYGNQLSFTTTNDDHEYVDLGLPSGLLWATCNVGADNPEDYGDYFAWGETQPKDTYSWSTYQYANGTSSQLTKYCNNSNYGYNGFTDNLTTLLPEDDVASTNWGSGWRLPTKMEWQELLENTTHIGTTQNGVNGRLFTASNGNSLFLPETIIEPDYSYGNYWSSSLSTYYPSSAWGFSFDMDWYGIHDDSYRSDGLSARAVRCKNSVINVTANSTECGLVSGGGTYMDCSSCTISATANEGYIFICWSEDGVMISTEATYSFTVSGDRNLVAYFYNYVSGAYHYVDLGLSSGLLWATCNVGASTPEGYGNYFAWGETQPKSTYNWNTYQYNHGGGYNTLTKYCTNPSYGYNGFTDNLTILLPENDAATVNWGNDWRMPTKEEWLELYNSTIHTFAIINGINGELFTAPNGNSLFLPAAGYRYESILHYAGGEGYYWSSSLYTNLPEQAWYLSFYSYGYRMYCFYRGHGRSVRAVRSSQN